MATIPKIAAIVVPYWPKFSNETKNYLFKQFCLEVSMNHVRKLVAYFICLKNQKAKQYGILFSCGLILKFSDTIKLYMIPLLTKGRIMYNWLYSIGTTKVFRHYIQNWNFQFTFSCLFIVPNDFRGSNLI